MEFMLSVDTEEFDYNAEIINLRKTNIERIEKHIAFIRSEAEVQCDNVALSLQRRQDTLTASTNSNIDKLTIKKEEDLKALMSRLERQQDILFEQEQLYEQSPDEDIMGIIESLRKNIANIQKTISGRDAQLQSDCQALLQQLETDAREMEALANSQCTEIRKHVETGELANMKAVLRLERHKLAVEEQTVSNSDIAMIGGDDTETEIDSTAQIRSEHHQVNKTLNYSSPGKKSPSKKAPSPSSSANRISSPTSISPRPRKKTGYSPSSVAAQKALSEEQHRREKEKEVDNETTREERAASTSIQFQKAMEIVARYHARGGILPRNLKASTPPSSSSSSPLSSKLQKEREQAELERDQECKDYINLNRWKQSLRGGPGDVEARRSPGASVRCNGLKWFGFCPDEVRDLLDEQMPTWRETRWQVDLSKSITDFPS